MKHSSRRIPTGDLIVRVLYERSGATRDQLADILKNEYDVRFDLLHMYLNDALSFLADARVIEIEGIQTPSDRDQCYHLFASFEDRANSPPIRVSSHYVNIVHALRFGGIGREETSQLYQMSCYPIFGPPKSGPSYDIFVAMPFADSRKFLYDTHVIKVVTGLSLTVVRADEIVSTGPIISNIWSAIYNSSILVADCTNVNANVFYEIGIAHTLGKKVILLIEKGQKMPIDIAHIKYIEYELGDKEMKLFEQGLRMAIADAMRDTFDAAFF
jgi:hypothetical protein